MPEARTALCGVSESDFSPPKLYLLHIFSFFNNLESWHAVGCGGRGDAVHGEGAKGAQVPLAERSPLPALELDPLVRRTRQPSSNGKRSSCGNGLWSVFLFSVLCVNSFRVAPPHGGQSVIEKRTAGKNFRILRDFGCNL